MPADGVNTNPSPGSKGSNYVMGRTSEEYERLRRQSKILAAITRSVLDRAGLTSGMRCLDVGCGAGEVMRLMAEMVGPAANKCLETETGHLIAPHTYNTETFCQFLTSSSFVVHFPDFW